MLHCIDERGCITEVSDRWLALLGYTWDEVIGRRSVDFLSEASARYAREVVLPEFWRTGSCSVEYEMRHRDGHLIPVRLEGVALRAAEGGPFTRSIAVVTDLTEQRALERKMFEVQKLESLGLMAGTIAHDFNNLLASVVGNAELARLHTDDPDAEAALANVLVATERAAGLGRQLLAYAGRGRFQRERVALEALVAEMATVLDVGVSRHARVVLELDATPHVLLAEPTQLRQIVMNLVLNAAEAFGAGRGTITLRTSTVTLDAAAIARTLQPGIEAGAYACLEVLDDGPGMTPDVRAHLFDPFFTTKPTGRGLGLAAVHGIVRGHRGTLVVDSEPGRGTRFAIYFPTREPAPALEPAPPAPPAPRGTVVVVDDDDLLCRTLVLQLEDAGFAAVPARTAAEARALATSTPISRFLVDVTMPGVSGPALVRELAEVARDAHFVLMSGFDAPDVPVPPHTRFLRKPFSQDELITALR